MITMQDYFSKKKELFSKLKYFAYGALLTGMIAFGYNVYQTNKITKKIEVTIKEQGVVLKDHLDEIVNDLLERYGLEKIKKKDKK